MARAATGFASTETKCGFEKPTGNGAGDAVAIARWAGGGHAGPSLVVRDSHGRALDSVVLTDHAEKGNRGFQTWEIRDRGGKAVGKILVSSMGGYMTVAVMGDGTVAKIETAPDHKSFVSLDGNRSSPTAVGALAWVTAMGESNAPVLPTMTGGQVQ